MVKGFRRAAALAALATMAWGCPQTVAPLDPDGGLPPPGTDGGLDASTAAADGGPGRDGSVGSDAGLADAGESAPSFDWSSLTLPPNTRSVTAVWGRGIDDLYIGTTNGRLLRFDRSAGWAEVWRSPSNFGVRAIWGTPTRLFVADEGRLYIFDGDPAAVGPDSYTAGNRIGDMHGLSEDVAFLVSERTSSRGLFRYEGGSVTEVAPNLQVASVNAVFAEAGPVVRVAANGKILRWDGVGLLEETIDWPSGWSANQIANHFMYDIERVGPDHFTVGTGGGVLTDEGGTWHFDRLPSGTDDLQALAAVPGSADPLAVAVGEPVGGRPIWWRSPTGWAPDPFDQNLHLLAAWAESADVVYAVGTIRNQFDGVVLRGVRR